MKRNETAIESTYGADAHAEFVDIADGVSNKNTVFSFQNFSVFVIYINILNYVYMYCIQYSFCASCSKLG